MTVRGSLSVSKAISLVQGLIDREIRSVVIEGEVTNIKASSNGHYYFSLSDDKGVLNSAIFKMDAFRNPLIKRVENGDKVICSGNLSIYPKRGTLQLIVKRIVKAGKGDLLVQFEELKLKLSNEGLFDLEKKKKIPKMSDNVVLITSVNGAAIKDFVNIFKRRSAWMNLTVIDAIVQGEHAPGSIRKALKRAQNIKENKIDVIVISRGGGSLEDLFCFNDEFLARDIFNCDIPVISAVGHQSDYTICDYVSDLRLETPSAAAEVLTESQFEVATKLSDLGKGLSQAMELVISKNKTVLEQMRPHRVVDLIYKDLISKKNIINACDIFERDIEIGGIYQKITYIDELNLRLTKGIEFKLYETSNNIDGLFEKLNILNPIKVLERGYTIVKDKSHNIISNTKNFDSKNVQGPLIIKFSDGEREVTKR